ncbi:unnamed protein product [Paramecium primaurelia]|uniref:Uncharacterized protein n=1 Tax=Paramecium primaurelia TaxID=5886 RepID=A0A8S1KD34_PARPR|nr:unnamed protein product [Paramecium primaurelia]
MPRYPIQQFNQWRIYITKQNISMINSFKQSYLMQNIGWMVETMKTLQFTIKQFNQKFLRNEGIIQNEMNQSKLEIEHERDRRIYKDLSKSIDTIISQILGIQEKELREQIINALLSPNNENQLQWSLKLQEEGKYNKATLIKKFIIIYHIKKRKIYLQGLQKNDPLVLYEKYQQFSLLKYKQKTQTFGNEQNTNTRISTEQSSLRKQQNVQIQSQKKYSYNANLNQQSTNKKQQVEYGSDSQEEQLFCKKCKKGLYSFFLNLQNTFKKCQQGKINDQQEKKGRFQKGGKYNKFQCSLRFHTFQFLQFFSGFSMIGRNTIKNIDQPFSIWEFFRCKSQILFLSQYLTQLSVQVNFSSVSYQISNFNISLFL